MREYLTILSEGGQLSREQAAGAMHLIMKGDAEPEETAAFLLGLRSRGETVEELIGFTEVMRSYALPVHLDDPNAIDIVGTGGDGAGTFNISTTAAFVCAGAGVTVAKHGNRAVSSRSGSADVLAELGVKTDLGPRGVEACLAKVGISFISAPFFHPAMKNVMPVRRKLGVRTFFNILGPLCNPACVQRMLVGAFSETVAKMMAGILHGLGAEYALTVCGTDGLDEITLSGPSRLFEVRREAPEVTEFTFEPESVGMRRVDVEVLRGGGAVENARILRSVLSGADGPLREVVLVNAAHGLLVSGRYDSLEDAMEAAVNSIDRRLGLAKLDALVETSHAVCEPDGAPWAS